MSGRRTLRSGTGANLKPPAEIPRQIKGVEAAIRQQSMELRKRQRRLTTHNRPAESNKGTDKSKARRPEANLRPYRPRPVQRPPDPVDSSSAPSCSDDDSEQGGYMTSGTSLKKKPGKRIRWRNAIKEDDYVRQDLTQEFLRVL